MNLILHIDGKDVAVPNHEVQRVYDDLLTFLADRDAYEAHLSSEHNHKLVEGVDYYTLKENNNGR